MIALTSPQETNAPDRESVAPSAMESASKAARLHEQGRHQEALRVASAALSTAPTNAHLWNIAAIAAFALNLREDAERFWTTALAYNPNLQDAHYNLGVLYLSGERLNQAAKHFSNAIRLNPNDAKALNNLGTVFARTQLFEQGAALFQRAITCQPDSPDAYENLVHLFTEINQPANALTCIDGLLTRLPKSAKHYVIRAGLLFHAGKAGAAERDMARAIALDPGLGRPHLFMIEQHKGRVPSEEVTRLENAYERRYTRSEEDQICLNFAMAKHAESTGQFNLSFAAYAEGNAMQHRRHLWNEQMLERRFETVTSSISSVLEQRGSDAIYKDAGNKLERTPVFIVGMPRSGTTLLERILSRHPDIFGAGELATLARLTDSTTARLDTHPEHTLWFKTLRALGDAYLAGLSTPEITKPVVIDKMPGNYQVAGLIPLMIPQAKIIHIRRNPLDTCFSCFSTLFAEGHEYSYDQAVLGREYGRYRRWMDYWRTVLPEETLLEIDYESLVDNLREVTERVLAHLGLEWHADCAAFHQSQDRVLTASFSQVRRPLYRSSIGRWQHFAEHLTVLRSTLATYLPETVN